MDKSIDERQQAIESCSCPREAGEALLAPKCAAEKIIGTVLFVKGHQFSCANFISFADGHICSCANRRELYKIHKL
jgi:hypothetical protein